MKRFTSDTFCVELVRQIIVQQIRMYEGGHKQKSHPMNSHLCNMCTMYIVILSATVCQWGWTCVHLLSVQISKWMHDGPFEFIEVRRNSSWFMVFRCFSFLCWIIFSVLMLFNQPFMEVNEFSDISQLNLKGQCCLVFDTFHTPKKIRKRSCSSQLSTRNSHAQYTFRSTFYLLLFSSIFVDGRCLSI